MYAVGRLGSYISRGVYTVSGPFHPFGGAVDIIVVEQQDGTFKSSPWYVRFGKFQGVLKTKEKVVSISVNGVEANFHMYLDHKGEAYFLREVDVEEGESVLSSSSSEEDIDGQSGNRTPVKFKSINYDAKRSNSVTGIDVSNGKVLARTNSRRSQILGLVFGRKEEDVAGVVRADSLERAEIAADLLEVRWSTNLASNKLRNKDSSQLSARDICDAEVDKDLQLGDEQIKVDSLVPNNMVHFVDEPLSNEETGSPNHEVGDPSRSSFDKLESSVEETGVEMSCLITEYVISTSTIGQSCLDTNNELNSATSRKNDEHNEEDDQNAKGIISEIAHVTQIPDFTELQACPSGKLYKEHILDEDTGLPDGGVFSEENAADAVESLFSCEASKNSRIGLDSFGVQADETLNLPSGRCGEDCVHAETLCMTAELRSEVNTQLQTSLLAGKEPMNDQGSLGDTNRCNMLEDAKILEREETCLDSIANSVATETYMVTFQPINGSIEEVESQNSFTISGFSHSNKEENNLSEIQSYLEPVGDLQEFSGDHGQTKSINISPSEGSDKEELLFGDLDDFKLGEVQSMESVFPDHVEKESHPSLASRGIDAANATLRSNYEPDSFPDKLIQKNLPNDVEESIKTKIISNNINIPRINEVLEEEVGQIVNSLPNMWSRGNDMDTLDLHSSLAQSLDSNSKSSKWMVLRREIPSCINSGSDNEFQLSLAQPTIEDAKISDELRIVPANAAVGDPSKAIGPSSGSWRLWPFSFKRSRSVKVTQPDLNCTRHSDVENAFDSTSRMGGEKDEPKPKGNKKKIREMSPMSEQLASLNLKEGSNVITFTFSTAMLGKQQVDARIYLWRWDTRIVISDVDGTITKSDVLGQFMPLVGMDWSQTGVAHLFSAIKENGYQLLFLSARAISQAYHTRQFLFNLKQDGKALPDGPVVISPDGLFPSLFREVIRRAPHEFKITCLEDIRALFPSDRNPFYAGFGNRDTDELSYLKVGIPKGKIFTINPKGEVAVNRRLHTKSYTSLHALVHDMFPPMSSSEQEDFNSWNFWKLPPPAIHI